MTATQTSIRHGTNSECNAATPASSELVHNTTNGRIHVGDALTAGGGWQLPTIKDIQTNSTQYAVAGGTADALTVTLSPAPAGLVAGMSFSFKAALNNTTAVTLAMNGLPAKNVKKMAGGELSLLEANDIVAGGIYVVFYDGSDYQLINVPVAAQSGIELLAVATASSSASLDFTSGIDGSYKNYGFLLNGIKPATTNTTFNLRVRRSGQGSFDSAELSYEVTGYSNITGITPPSSTYMTLTGTIPNTSYGVSGWLNMLRNVSGEYAHFDWKLSALFGGSNYWGSGYRDATTVIDGVQFRYSSGNIAEGEIYMFGVRSSL